MGSKAVYQVKREDLTDAEYARIGRLFEFIRRVKSRRASTVVPPAQPG